MEKKPKVIIVVLDYRLFVYCITASRPAYVLNATKNKNIR